MLARAAGHRLRRHPLGARLLDTLKCAALLDRRRVAFVLREFRVIPGGVRDYTLATAGRATVFIRHGTSDLAVLRDVFLEEDYAAPSEVPALRNDGPLKVLDLGANIGLFGAWLAARHGPLDLVAFEPDPSNVAILRRCAEANERAGCWMIVEACAGIAEGQAAFISEGGWGSRVAPEGTRSDRVVYVPVRDVLPLLADPGVDLVKMDIEGAEQELLLDGRFAQARVSRLVIEYHPNGVVGTPSRDLAVERLGAAGYETALVPPAAPDRGLVWAWKS